jgi:5,5'-dehydrodivanillate O-demethylase oxygenase subunit
MLSQEENALLTQVGPGTPMGQLMRWYWQPIASAADLLESPFRTKEVKVLGEELVLYRDRSGRLGLVDRRCAHRRAGLAYGVVEDDGIRCQYHGWKYDRTGRCVEQPFEDTLHPEARFRDKCSIRAYPVEELAGLVFAYLGPDPVPLLPRWAPLVWENAIRDICITELPCNWLQCQENSLDPVHLEWLHMYAGPYFRSIIAGEEPQPREWTPRHQKIGFDAFEHGIVKRRVTLGHTEEDADWKIGHPIMFPNVLLVGNPLQCTLQFRVPVDDTHTLHVSLYTWRAAPGEPAPSQDVVPSRMVPLRDGQDRFLLERVFNQDYMCWVTQGEIAERHLEKLGESDRGIIMFRKTLLDQLALVRDGREPSLNVFRDRAANVCVELPLEREPGGSFDERTGEFHGWHEKPPKYSPAEAGFSRDAAKIDAVMATWKSLDRQTAGVR